jgi:hypothetical protein
LYFANPFAFRELRPYNVKRVGLSKFMNAVSSILGTALVFYFYIYCCMYFYTSNSDGKAAAAAVPV